MSEHHGLDVTKEKPVTIREMILYGTGTICNGLVNSTYNLLTPLMVLILGMNPVLPAMIISVKTLWDAVTDPFMASITDNANTRWGRRRPFIFAGGVLTVALVVSIWTFIPVGDSAKPNVKKTAVAEQPAASQPAAADVKQETTAAASAETKEQPAKPALPAKPAKKSTWQSVKEGTAALKTTSAQHKKIFFYLMVGLMLLATTHTVFSVPYYALGIELSPTYHGRTRVVAFRSMFDSTFGGLLSPWYLPFCMMVVFPSAIHGMKWLAILIACFALPGVLTSALCTRERTHVDKSRKKVNMIASIVATARNPHFLKVAALYIILQLTLGLFMQFSLYVNIFHVFGGDAETAMQFGARMQGKVGMLGGLLALSSIPFITWVCGRFQKHNALRLALGMTATGCVLNWFCYTPANPNLQFILPFFYSLGISSTFTVLSTLMADVTDMDELTTGTRREGMFGAVNAWMMKGVGAIQALAAGLLLLASGLDPQAVSQTPETVLRMRIFFSFVPAACLFLAMLLLYRYPLTRARMAEIRQILDQRKKDAAVAQEQA